jgi:hypothetical protein
VNGNLIEAKKRSAELKDVEPDDFVRFLEYAYRRNYTVPPWTHDESAPAPIDAELQGGSPEGDEIPPAPDDVREEPVEAAVELVPEPEAVASVEDDWSMFPRPVNSKKKRDKVFLRSTFQQRSYLETVSSDKELIDGFEPKSNSAADQEFTSVFLAHARLYTFAEMRLIQPLKSLALCKLHKTLIGFQLYEQRVGDVVQLARYAYYH